tara:strand:- start:1398 stop:1706 length:309 start_codon:yes stop_codon:yes gene_type:complete
MIVKRNLMNEYIIRDFLNGNITGYSAEHNGEWYFSLDNYYNSKVALVKTDMGQEVIHLRDEDDITYAANRIQETLIDLPNILEREKSIDEYCSNNPWTYSGT